MAWAWESARHCRCLGPQNVFHPPLPLLGWQSRIPAPLLPQLPKSRDRDFCCLFLFFFSAARNRPCEDLVSSLEAKGNRISFTYHFLSSLDSTTVIALTRAPSRPKLLQPCLPIDFPAHSLSLKTPGLPDRCQMAAVLMPMAKPPRTALLRPLPAACTTTSPATSQPVLLMKSLT